MVVIGRVALLACAVGAVACGGETTSDLGSTSASSAGNAGTGGHASAGHSAAGQAGATGGFAGASSGAKDMTNACVPFPPKQALAPSAQPLIAFVFEVLLTGDVDWAGKGDGSAWQLYSRNLDEAVSHDAKDTPCAKPGPQALLEDGPCGQDTCFLTMGYASTSPQYRTGINNGAYSMAVVLDPVVFQGKPSNRGRLTSLRPRSAPPVWDGSDEWTPDANDGSANAPLWEYSIVTGGKLFARTQGAGIMMIYSKGVTPGRLILDDVEIVADVSDDGLRLTHGVLAARVMPSRLTSWYDTSSCSLALEPTFSQWVEMSENPKNPLMCDRVSMGLGFEATRGVLLAPSELPKYATPCSP